MKSKDYEKAKELKLTQVDRWEEGRDHHPMSRRVMEFLYDYDWKEGGDTFDWSMGGDGDNGETLMYQMDVFFELLDRTERRDCKGDDDSGCLCDCGYPKY